jgi:predicted oxidoreductase (fatty acid repression mutant protein)
MEKTFLEAVAGRRTCYAITGDSPIGDERVTQIVGSLVRNVPSAFNSQGARVAVLFGQAHARLWSITMETLRSRVAPEAFAKTEEKIASFARGHGTILYFDDTAVTQGLQAQFPSYRDNFPIWAQQANGMLQFAVWTALEQEGLGASLQHYNPLIDQQVKEAFSLPESWQLIAQMPFGTPSAQPGEKTFQPLEERMVTFDR